MPKRSLVIFLLAACATFCFAGSRPQPPQPKLTQQNSGTTQLLIAVSPVNSQVVWAAGTGGTYVVTTDGGNTWTAGVVPGAEALQFRDGQGVSDKVAYLLSIGTTTTNFMIYKTVDGGATWNIEFTNESTNAFYDCFAFWGPDRGIAHSDSVHGIFPDLRTTNGITWNPITDMPPALPGEASFSSSGTCITTQGEENAWIATGGSTIARILATRDGGDTWNAYDTPLVSSPTAGGLSVAFRDPWHGVVGGGDLNVNDHFDMARSSDGGQTWTRTSPPLVKGTIFGLAYVRGNSDGDAGGSPDDGLQRAVVVTAETAPNFTSGPAAWTPDEGQTWYSLPKVSGFWAVAFANPHAGWFVGNNGTILKISF